MGVIAVFLLSIAGTGLALSPPVQKGKAGDKAAKGLSLGGVVDEVSPNEAMKAPIRVVHSGHGFALSGSEFHVLRVHIVRARHIQPMYSRELMVANKSIEEIKAEIEGKRWTPFYRGHLRLGESHYRLVNLSGGDDRNFTADIVKPSENGEIVGNISVTIMNYEGVRIGDGTLTMTEGDYIGEYRVLLDILPPLPRPMPRPLRGQ